MNVSDIYAHMPEFKNIQHFEFNVEIEMTAISYDTIECDHLLIDYHYIQRKKQKYKKMRTIRHSFHYKMYDVLTTMAYFI